LADNKATPEINPVHAVNQLF